MKPPVINVDDLGIEAIYRIAETRQVVLESESRLDSRPWLPIAYSHNGPLWSALPSLSSRPWACDLRHIHFLHREVHVVLFPNLPQHVGSEQTFFCAIFVVCAVASGEGNGAHNAIDNRMILSANDCLGPASCFGQLNHPAIGRSTRLCQGSISNFSGRCFGR